MMVNIITEKPENNQKCFSSSCAPHSKSGGITKVILIHPLRTMNVSTKFYGNLLKSY